MHEITYGMSRQHKIICLKNYSLANQNNNLSTSNLSKTNLSTSNLFKPLQLAYRFSNQVIKIKLGEVDAAFIQAKNKTEKIFKTKIHSN